MNESSLDINKIRQRLLDGDHQPVLELGREKKRVLSLLTALTYDLNPVVSQGALELSGQAAAVIFQRDPEYVRNYLLRLFWLVNDESGGIGWRAPELIGEILYHCPQLDQFHPLLISLLDLEKEDVPRFLPGVLWAVGRVAQTRPDRMQPALPYIRELIADGLDVPTREVAEWCLVQLSQG